MARDFSTSRFTSVDVESDADADPRVGLVNLADVMLVFACGLMLALVSFWNLDISSMQEMIQTDEVSEVQDVESLTEEAAGGGGGFVELGKVYQDPMTGKYYMLQEDIEGNPEAEGGSGTEGSGDAGAEPGSAGAEQGNEGEGTENGDER